MVAVIINEGAKATAADHEVSGYVPGEAFMASYC